MPAETTPAGKPPDLILASGSRYRAELLRRLTNHFRCEAPDVDESRRPGEPAEALAPRLAETKAQAIARHHPDCWVLGSDQVAALGSQVLGKPGDLDTARRQLRACSGQAVRFVTAVCLHTGAKAQTALDRTTVRFRALDAATIERYLAAEPALDCAGSFKCEGLGISLFEAIETRDPTALIGLPLIATARLLRDAGWRLP